jgi:membrane protein YdbS with pleckstrin-like domain
MGLEDYQDVSIDDLRFEAGSDATEEEASRSEEPGPVILDGGFHPLHENYVAASRVNGWIGAGIAGIGLPIGLAILIWTKEPGRIGVLLLIAAAFLLLCAMVFLAHFWPVFEFRHTRWRLDGDGLEIRRGVVWRHTISIPRTRIQHTDVAVGPIQRRFGLATLAVHTAGTHASQIDLEGIGKRTAQAIGNYLLEDEESSREAPRRNRGVTDIAGEEFQLPPMSEGSLGSTGSLLIEQEEDE